MKIVIDIPEEEYELVRHGNKSYTTELELMYAVANGTPLPEHHGDLIDRGEVIKSLFDFVKGTKTIGQCVDDTPTIIEGSDSE